MIFRAIEKAHDAVEDVAIEAAYGIAAILLTCCAYIFAAVGVVLWLATMMPLYAALLIVAIFTVICAAIVYLIGQRPQSEPKEEEEAPTGSSQLTSLAKSFSSMGAPLDLVASGLLARQMKKAPIATIAATAALGAFISVMASSDDGEG